MVYLLKYKYDGKSFDYGIFRYKEYAEEIAEALEADTHSNGQNKLTTEIVRLNKSWKKSKECKLVKKRRKKTMTRIEMIQKTTKK